MSRERLQELLAAERSKWLESERHAYRTGYTVASAQIGQAFADGYAAAIADIKRTDHGIVRSLRRLPRKISTRRRPRDFPGGEAGLARVRASWAEVEQRLQDGAA